ncbi:hypothetical protein D3C81_07460 [compost metagenome]
MLLALIQACTHHIVIDSDTAEFKVYRVEGFKNPNALELFKLFGKVHKDFDKMELLPNKEIIQAYENAHKNRDLLTSILSKKMDKLGWLKVTDDKQMLDNIYECLKLNMFKISNFDSDAAVAGDILCSRLPRNVDIEFLNKYGDVVGDAGVDELWSKHLNRVKWYIEKELIDIANGKYIR